MGNLASIVKTARKRLLQMHFESGVGHIGGNLSALDIIMVLYHAILRKDDVFILSKGHAAGAIYVALWSLGRLSDDELRQFHAEGTKLSGHPAPNCHPDIPFATGSLGHGLSLAAGIALGKNLQEQAGRVFCLLSDGEMQEGSTWEGLIFAAHHRIPLTILIDVNGLQGFGRTHDVAGLDLTVSKFREFGLPAELVDGHDLQALTSACRGESAGPRVVIARTCKGRGVSFMEDRIDSHYLPLSEPQYRQALEEVDAS
jgi:transketolase